MAQVEDVLQQRVDAALERARPVLREHLRLQRSGVRALVCLAAAHDGLTTEDKDFARAIRRLARVHLKGTYDVALRLMVMAEVADFPNRDRLITEDTESLLNRRLRGGFTYPGGGDSWDLSNTQYAALGLRAAAALGESVDADVWQKMAEVVLDLQAEDGGFAYTKRMRRHQPYASMTVAGIAVLQICRQQLGDAAPDGIEEAVARGWKWMAEHVGEIGDIDTLSCFYFHYGLERAAILSDVTAVGEVNWYAKGVEMFLVEQLRSGAWRSFKEIRPGALPGEGSPVDTAFAVLFLRRKFQKVLTPPLTGVRGFGALTDNSNKSEIERVAKGVAARGREAIPEVLKTLRSRMVTRRKAAALALAKLSGEAFDYQPERLPDESGDAIKAAELWWLKEGRSGK